MLDYILLSCGAEAALFLGLLETPEVTTRCYGVIITWFVKSRRPEAPHTIHTTTSITAGTEGQLSLIVLFTPLFYALFRCL
jgi:hypothetical protein